MQKRTRTSLAVLAMAVAGFACRDTTAPEGLRTRPPTFSISPSVVVSPGDMHGWSFINDQTNTPCTNSALCGLVSGPTPPPAGTGSAELATTSAADGVALALQAYQGTRLDAIEDLHYSTFRKSSDAGNNLAIALQLNVDYDLADQSVGYQGRLVFEPYQGNGGGVPQNTWQTWDAKAGKWWGTKVSVPVNGVLTTNPCVQATPCTWAQLLASFPNAGIHTTYGAVLLKAGSGWPSFRGNVDKLTIAASGTTATFDFELQAKPAIPAIPPDGLPGDYADPTAWVSGGEHFAGTIVRDIVALVFRPGTSQADRQAAVDLVGGVVVGGLRFSATDGVYLVRVPTDGTIEPLFQAIAALRALPQVSIAMADEIIRNAPTYRRPMDGAGEQKADWRLNADSAFGNAGRKSWALEASNAPYAWGCATGGTTRVAVMDMGLHAAGDIVANIDTSNTLPASTTFNHGTWVASVLAAKGDDSLNITGMMWSAKLDLRDVATVVNGKIVTDTSGKSEISSSSEMITAAFSMAARGDRVVNISLGSNTPGSGPHTAKQDSARAAYGHVFKEAAAAATVRPLWVVSAGNMGHSTDVYWESIAGIADSLPDETIIVTGAGAARGTLSPDATGVGAIHIAAPGEQVAVQDGTGVYQKDGSSFATPLVSGAAGLLFDFDSTLTAIDARSFLIEAATASGRTAGAYPLLDAYGALKRAGLRPSAPLCGNRVYIDNLALTVQRKNGTTEAIGVVDSFPPGPGNGWINAKHGGRRIDVFAYPNTYAFEWHATGWTRQPIGGFPGTTKDDGGAFNAAGLMTHDGDSLTFARINQDTVTFFVSDTVSWLDQQIGMMLLPILPKSVGACDFEDYSGADGGYKCRSFNYSHGQAGSFSPQRSVVSPIDGSLFFTIGFQTDKEVGGPANYWNCGVSHVQLVPFGPITDFDIHCRDRRNYIQTLDSLRIYRVDRKSGAAKYLASRQNAIPTNVSVSEDGRELLLSYMEATTGGFTYSWRTEGRDNTVRTPDPINATCITTAIEIKMPPGGPTLGAATQLARDTGTGCPIKGSRLSNPTFAPSRRGVSSGRAITRP